MEEFNCRGKLSSLTLESVSPDPELPKQDEEQRLFVAKLFYDHSGLLIRKQEPRKTTFYHYNDDKQLEKEVEVRDAEHISREKIYQYSAGRLLSEVSEEERVSYHYNSRDKLNFTTSWVGDIQESVCSYVFDDRGLVTLKEIRDSEGLLLRSCQMKRNPQGLITEEIIINQNNIILEHNRYEYTVFHGENWLKRECYRIEEGREPVLRGILYRNISLAPESAPESSLQQAMETPSVNEEMTEELPEELEKDLPENEEAPQIPLNIEKKLRFKNGLYQGSVNGDNKPEGQGEFWGKDGSRYSGGFHKGEMEGKGNLLHKNGSSYTGDFHKGLPHGEGECLWPDGNRYRGEFFWGEMHGIGSFTWTDGTRFTGLFEHNKSTDQGLLENAELPGEETE
ncbi:hypothetical protein EXM22_15445 [Oceanispirochaeta crateris]|uniref:MORN repeat-containing protein n=1 Tax=Oceanispirochaeta crateris TaxID=2518645 RepID=A0A5C1QRP8_9SPIO|nr:hypothetical protein [Oceanispirochaeta crateris]QEN09304.1 hypothetical protein EXM22_15445 [Oceanispirochaeta crateris]